MTLESQIYARLTGFAGLAALVSNRVFPNIAPQNVASRYIVYRLVSRTKARGFTGGSGMINQSRYQFDGYAETFAEMKSIESQIEEAFKDWDNEAGTPAIVDAEHEMTNQSWESASLLHHTIVDFTFYYRE